MSVPEAPPAGSECLSDDELAGLVAGALDRALERRLSDHVDACDLCRRLVSALAQVERAGAEPPAELGPGAQVGRFTLVRLLGRGAMGQVWAARDPQLDREVAIKLLHVSAASLETVASPRLRREAQAMARLDHPNVVAIHELGVDGGRVFCAMALVDGVTLRDWCATPRRWRDVLAVAIAAGRGLAAAHAAGLVHRDVKPENILIARDGRALVTDFGLAKLADTGAIADGPAGAAAAHDGALATAETVTDNARAAERGSLPIDDGRTLTRTGALIGTPAYMP
ncbi:MAG TPA: serine/threonine-protein kinase, partial [Kofleriaceae bacterium]|nr:serine/threonine-protein kinase [Kofleriaceae bacterium]